jgi:hypothetical protein
MRSLFVHFVFAASIFTSAGICLAQQTDPSRARVTSEVERGPGEVRSLDALRQFNSSLITLAKKGFSCRSSNHGHRICAYQGQRPK